MMSTDEGLYKAKKSFLVYLCRFLLTFSILYYGTIAMIGITSPGGYYSAFAAHYLDYVSALRWLLLHAAKLLLEVAGYNIYLKDIYTIRVQNGLGVHVGYDCIGYGVLSFWIAFIVANRVRPGKTLRWLFGGVALIFLVNILRIALMLVSVNNHWKPVLNLDNHGWFNIAAYIVIFTMIYLFDRSEKRSVKE